MIAVNRNDVCGKDAVGLNRKSTKGNRKFLWVGVRTFNQTCLDDNGSGSDNDFCTTIVNVSAASSP